MNVCLAQIVATAQQSLDKDAPVSRPVQRTHQFTPDPWRTSSPLCPGFRFSVHPLEDNAGGEKFVIFSLSPNLRPFNTTRHDQFGEKDLDDFVALISGFAAHL